VLPEAYDVLHANLFFRDAQPRSPVVTWSDPNPRVGEDLGGRGLGPTLRPERAHKVLIIDGDMRAGALSSRFQTGLHPGLVELLQGTVDPTRPPFSLGPDLRCCRRRPSRVKTPPSLLSGSDESPDG